MDTIRNSKYYKNEIKKILDDCARKNNVSAEEYDKITELMSEKMRLNVKEKLSSRSDVEVIANQFRGYMFDYLKQAKEKCFFKANTIISNLTILNSINNISDRCSTYGAAGVGAGNVSFSFENHFMQNDEFRKEVFFHEVTHHLINRNIDMQSIALSGKNKRQELQELEQKLGIPVWESTTFLAELLTEEMAQQLICNERPAKTKVSVGEAMLESNYTPEYNRQYQTLGTEFIKTLSECADNNEENMMKKAILYALDDNCDFISIIKNNYFGKEEDLKTIFSAFKKVLVEKNISYDEAEKFFRITERNYTLDYTRPTLERTKPISIRASHQSRLKIQKGTQTQATSHLKIKKGTQTQATPHLKIKKGTSPQEISEATREYAEENHGEVIRRKNIFERLFISRKRDRGEK